MTPFTYIDYEDMLQELKEDLEQGFITNESSLYIIRQNTPVTLPKSNEAIYPILDYFYTDPKLNSETKVMSIADAKKTCYALLDSLKAQDCPISGKDTFAEVLEVIVQTLGEYTKGKSKRNDEPVSLIYTQDTNLPFTFYYDSDDASDCLETISVSTLLEELNFCNQH